MATELISIVKRSLGYAWCDENTEQNIQDRMTEGIEFLKRYDPEADFENNINFRGLLIEYVRYAMANARDDFAVNYRSELVYISDVARSRNVDIQSETK